MSFFIVGTAGHIDHGKTKLSKRLTGITTDRLKEEQERGISIKLGFAPLILENGIKIGLVDVPGHEKFIRQMLAGVGGMDVVILVIDAGEGVMPQTKEHLNIIQLLGIEHLIVALTKIDLVDEDWVQLMTEEVRDYLKEKHYENIPIIPVSSMDGRGIEELKKALEEVLNSLPEKEKGSFPRLPIDRAFSLTGFGTIVTGTLWSGSIQLGDTLELLPQGKVVKVRNIQVHGEDKEIAEAGQRVAINLPDIKVKEIETGSVLVPERRLEKTYKITTEFTLLADKEPLLTRENVRIHLGTNEVLGKIILLEGDDIQPGETKLCAFYLSAPLTTLKGDRLIIRTQTPVDTIGGATVIEAYPEKIKRLDPLYLEKLRKKKEDSKEDILLSQIEAFPFINLEGLQAKTTYNLEEIKSLLAENSQDILMIGTNYLLKSTYEQQKRAIVNYVNDVLIDYPLRPGVKMEEIKSKYLQSLKGKDFSLYIKQLIEDEAIQSQGEYILPLGFKAAPNQEDQKILTTIEEEYLKDSFTTKAPEEMGQLLSLPKKELQEYYNYLVNCDHLVKVGENIYFSKSIYEKGVTSILEYIKENGSIKLNEARDILNTSRKYVLPILENLDQQKITKRTDDVRVLF